MGLPKTTLMWGRLPALGEYYNFIERKKKLKSAIVVGARKKNDFIKGIHLKFHLMLLSKIGGVKKKEKGFLRTFVHSIFF